MNDGNDSPPPLVPLSLREDNFGRSSSTGPSPLQIGLSSNLNSSSAQQKQRVDLACNNCGTHTTTIWRRDANGIESELIKLYNIPSF